MADQPTLPGLFDDLPDEQPAGKIARISFKHWKRHLAELRKLEATICGMLDSAIKQALKDPTLKRFASVEGLMQSTPFLREWKKRIGEQLAADLTATIEQADTEAWLRSNAANDAVVAAMAARNKELASLLQTEKNKPQNNPALRAFLDRETQGMTLSDRVWKVTEGMGSDMGRAIEVAIAEGTPAQKLSQRVRELLNEPNKLFRRVRDKKTGELKLSQAAQAYHPGAGVYRSSYKNAMRLARTEVNMAYHVADTERWTKSWWVIGIRVQLSNNHTVRDSKGKPQPLVDICDELAGDYPADFKFSGWHPQCRCFATAITCDYATIRDYYRRKREGEDMTTWEPPGKINEPPAAFRDWLSANRDRLTSAEQRGTTPFFIRDNAKYTGAKPLPQTTSIEPPKKTIQEIAAERHAVRTPKEILDIQFRWSRRRFNRMGVDSGKMASADLDRYNKLYDMTSLANKGSFNIAEFNSMYNIVMRHYRRTPTDIQKIRERWDARYIAQAGETKQLAAMRKALEKQKITSIADVQRIMDEFYNQFPEEFNNTRIKFISFDRPPTRISFTMGYSKHDIEIAFNSNKGWSKESPLDTIIKALDKLRTGKTLNLEQLRSVTTIVHELLHQKAGQYVNLKAHGAGDFKRTAMEAMNELASRVTTARFIRRLGGNTEGVTQLIAKGDGYTTWVKRILDFCKKAEINPEILGQEWATTLTTERYDTMDARLYAFFKSHADKKGFIQNMDEALAAFEDESSSRKWNAMMKKWFP